jgi:thioredoxin reductase (NADPH)
LIEAGRIQAHFNTFPLEITPSHVVLNTQSLPFDFVLLLTGYEADLSLLKKAGVKLDGQCQTPVFDERTMETSIPGIYVAGCAIGGTQDKYTIFLENCHIHIPRILAALTGAQPPVNPSPVIALPET